MKKNITSYFLAILFPLALISQNDLSIYATMNTAEAYSFQELYPEGIQILSSNDFHAAVLISEELTHRIHENVPTHGPGYIFRASEEAAIAALDTRSRGAAMLDFSITEDVFVNECLDLVDGNFIEDDILNLQNYGTRYHTKPQAEQAVLDQKEKWDAMIAASGRTDVHTRIFEHVNTPMPSVILTIDGANTPEEYVIIGGHIDSTSWDKDDAPGADDNASGIASLNEMVRVLLEKQFVPNRTIEVMAYAAEEIGLVGSQEIANEYANNNVNVIAYVQFDMTGYQGSNDDIFITTDSYNSSGLNGFLVNLMDHYNSSGQHSFTYNYTICGYGCSDHYSWAENGYETSFPFEAAMSQDNQNIHTPGDVYSYFNTPDHSVKFTKLGLEFLIETAKPQTLGVEDFSSSAIDIFTSDKFLNYRLKNTGSPIRKIEIYNIAGKLVSTFNVANEIGSISLQKFADGFYIAHFILQNNHTLSKKIILD